MTECEDLITPEQAAAMKGVKPATVYRAMKEKRLPCRHVLGRYGLDPAEVEKWQPSTHGGIRPGQGRKRKDADG